MNSNLINLPPPNVYEKEYEYWPWGQLIRKVKDCVMQHADDSGHIIDYMCGTGYLLNEIHHKRPDLTFEGCSITKEYIDYANKTYPNLQIIMCDIMDFKPKQDPSIIISTGGLHHLTREVQNKFVEKIYSELKSGRYFILGEELISNYRNERERKLAVMEMTNNLIQSVINKSAPDDVIESAINLIKNDMFERGEYKSSLESITELLDPYFSIINIIKTWPDNGVTYGDYIFVTKRK